MRSQGLLELGKKLVSELDLDKSTDTLGRWMAHHIAELLDQAERAKGDETQDARARCFDAILKLWDHRGALPSGRRPFEDAGPILRALASLDPDEAGPRYYRAVWASEPEPEEETESKKWLNAVDSIDHTARLLIRYCLTQAARTTIDTSKEWVRLAEAAGKDDGPEVRAIRIIIGEETLLNVEPEDAARKVLKDRIERLNEFVGLAKVLSQEIKIMLDQDKDKKSKKRPTSARKRVRKTDGQ